MICEVAVVQITNTCIFVNCFILNALRKCKLTRYYYVKIFIACLYGWSEEESDEEERGWQRYKGACQLLQVTPSRRLLTQLHTSSIQLAHRNIGRDGARALAHALKVFLPHFSIKIQCRLSQSICIVLNRYFLTVSIIASVPNLTLRRQYKSQKN